MRITALESLHADGGWRPFSFLKVSTDEGLVGWSEYACGPWAPALPEVIGAMGQNLIGRDPQNFNLLRREMAAATRFTAGGLSCQAAAAIENACIDIAAKSANLSVAQLFGGALRTEIAMYWTHCGSFRARDPELFESLTDRPRLDSLDAIRALGKEIADRGFKAAKTNPMMFTGGRAKLLNPGFVPHGLDLGGTLDAETLFAIEAQVEALRDGAGETIDLMLDVNFGFSPQSVVRLDRKLAQYRLRWLEYDHQSFQILTALKSQLSTPLASLEAVHECGSYKPFLDQNAVDVAVIDLLWNGFAEALRIANLCVAGAVNVAPHNFYGPLADLISAHFCAVVPNFEIMEFEADDVPWKYDLLTNSPAIEEGRIQVPVGPGWGADVNEEVVRERPWRSPI